MVQELEDAGRQEHSRSHDVRDICTETATFTPSSYLVPAHLRPRASSPPPTMSSDAQLARQMAGLKLGKPAAAPAPAASSTARPAAGHTRTTSQTEVAKLLAKMAPPNLPVRTVVSSKATLPAPSRTAAPARTGTAAAPASALRKTASQTAFKPLRRRQVQVRRRRRR
jgi:hypothetical protein